ncbi:bifunctional diaminohydroxyphosphoribosylaminopyrimidine deaminase/5-amino-6-(5-phosphoribosylamino)uracil reductase RibD [Flavobacteriaceae bacterium R33]|uniref:Riboflavin biosynthesis protein RibD n=2 Tax=Poritiphilus flavus TaxID=2697053 RepID=A0A6L9EFU2_9FLAO|nr:bifunctional diaminohydroxyphosphoribosylaminopyrimidine deaminase/5-amino-6-(5-phosphoribosylamino)uracil reductase RibD [Poritiphilus flavus]
MLRCLQLGKKGLGSTAPNPIVGCVIVHQGKIIGEGFTSPYGGPHAEVNAIASVNNKDLLSSSTLYVSLEPCSHYGKTPPCADLILKHKIPEIIIGIPDPHSKVAGKGIQKLRDAGCEVAVGLEQAACREHHRRFLTFHEKQRPYIILKWAETADGFIAPESAVRTENPAPYWITGRASRQLVHQWRSEEQGILVGTNTVLLDNPKLNTRDWEGRSPMRIILDKDLKVPHHYAVLDRTVETLVLTQSEDEEKRRDGIVYEALDFSGELASRICRILYQHQVQSVLIEGGARTLQSFIDEGLWDEARIFRGSVNFEKGLKAPVISGHEVQTRMLDRDQLTIVKP